MALLEVQGLTAGYGIVQVLFGLDFSVDAGEAVVILGANGSGKTTTLRAVSGMIAAGGGGWFVGRGGGGVRPPPLLPGGGWRPPPGG
ncbi:MAG TPA: ATP-binding cassette domain-containing protein, partial [Microthrixaceae bacterium]|nr:ATP-binding cassette domain-containing protein [Microthrixaceae bacterium]